MGQPTETGRRTFYVSAGDMTSEQVQTGLDVFKRSLGHEDGGATFVDLRELLRADWVQDVADLHAKHGVRPIVRAFDQEKLRTYLQFRIDFLQEELDELKDALELAGTSSAEDAVDALIDLSVVAIGTLDVFGVDAHEAWSRVHEKNMQKHAGVNPARPNALGLPDLVKPPLWEPPSHAGNVGLFARVFT